MTWVLTASMLAVAGGAGAVAGVATTGSVTEIVSAATGLVALLAALVWVPMSKAMRERRRELDEALLRIETSMAVIRSMVEDLRRMQAIHEKRLDTVTSVLWRQGPER